VAGNFSGKVGIIGVGNMGGACARAWLAQGRLPPERLVLVERDELKAHDLRSTLGWEIDGNERAIGGCAIVFLAMKPQDLAGAAAGLREHLHSGQTVVSLLAGVPFSTLRALLGDEPRFVRVMPNINAAIRAGMSVWCRGPGVDSVHAVMIGNLLEGIGGALEVKEEALIDAATAVSASGPGYIFYIIEHMVGAAEKLGFSRAEADELVAQTIAGSVAMWRESKLEPEELRAMVTSKGGTTAAAVEVFERGYLGKILKAGIARADERCRELAELAKVKS
jgi:pyrroline-5-carboxylate reductase